MAEHPHVKVSYRRQWGEYRVHYLGLHKDREEATAYYTDDREDADGTAVAMEEASHKIEPWEVKDFSVWPELKMSKRININGR